MLDTTAESKDRIVTEIEGILGDLRHANKISYYDYQDRINNVRNTVFPLGVLLRIKANLISEFKQQRQS